MWTMCADSIFDDEYGQEYDVDDYEYFLGNSDFVSTNNYTQCFPAYNAISCNITLNAQNFKEYATSLYPRRKKDHRLRYELRCVSCDLDAFPNEIPNSGIHWKVLNFANSNIKQLKMNILNGSAANIIQHLYLRNNSITHLDDDSLPTSDTLIDLDLSHNLIANVTGNRTFEKMRYLEILRLSHNFITHLEPFVFQYLESLKKLELNNNFLLETSFTGNLHGFRTALTLSNNPFIYLEPNIKVIELNLRNSSITNCSIGTSVETLTTVNGTLQTIDLSKARNLRSAKLSFNQLTYFEFKNPLSLEVLYLNNNKLRTIKIGYTRSLGYVYLARNNITNTLNISLPASLLELDLSHNNLTNLDPETFKNLTFLRRLYLEHCKLHELNAETVLPPSMKYLDLSNNMFVTMDLNIFKRLTGLNQLILNGNRLTDLNVEDIQNTTQLGISNNEWNCTRLKVIVDILSRRDAIIMIEPCDPLTCKENISGIACHTEEYLAVSDVTEASHKDSVAEERIIDNEDRIWRNVEANLTVQHPENVGNQNMTSLVPEIKYDPVSNVTEESHKDSKAEERIIDNENRIWKTVHADTTIPTMETLKNTHHEDSKAYQTLTTAIILIVIGLLVFVAAAIYGVIVKQRKRRLQRLNYVVKFSEERQSLPT